MSGTYNHHLAHRILDPAPYSNMAAMLPPSLHPFRTLRKNMACSSDQLAMKCVKERSRVLGFPNCPWSCEGPKDGVRV